METSHDQSSQPGEEICMNPSLQPPIVVSTNSSSFAPSHTSDDYANMSYVQSSSNASVAFVPSASSYNYGVAPSMAQQPPMYQPNAGQTGYTAAAGPHSYTTLMASQYPATMTATPNYAPPQTNQDYQSLPEPTQSLQSDDVGYKSQNSMDDVTLVGGTDECGGKDMAEYTPNDLIRHQRSLQHVEASDSDTGAFVHSAHVPMHSGGLFVSQPQQQGLFATTQLSGNLFDEPHPAIFEQSDAGDDIGPGVDECDLTSNKQQNKVIPKNKLTGLANITCDKEGSKVNSSDADNKGEKPVEVFNNWERKKKVRKVKNYEPCQLKWAIFAVQQKRLNMTEASRLFHIPRKTLADNVKAFAGKCPLTVSQDINKESGAIHDTKTVTSEIVTSPTSSSDPTVASTSDRIKPAKKCKMKDRRPQLPENNVEGPDVGNSERVTNIPVSNTCTRTVSQSTCEPRDNVYLGQTVDRAVESTHIHTAPKTHDNPQASQAPFSTYQGTSEIQTPFPQTQYTLFPSVPHQHNESQVYHTASSVPMSYNYRESSSHYNPAMLINPVRPPFSYFPHTFPPNNCADTAHISSSAFYGQFSMLNQLALPMPCNSEVRMPFETPSKSAFETFSLSANQKTDSPTAKADILQSSSNLHQLANAWNTASLQSLQKTGSGEIVSVPNASPKQAVSETTDANSVNRNIEEQQTTDSSKNDSQPPKQAKAKRSRGQYDKIFLDSAVKAVESGILIPSVAARIFKVPRRTICDNVKSRRDPLGSPRVKGDINQDTAPRPRFDYDQASLSNAIDAVRSKRLTLSEAVIEFRIPKNTLIGWMNRVGKNKMAVPDMKNDKKINILQKRPALAYNSQDLDKALEAVMHHGKTVTEAAALFRVNRRTLNDRVLKAKRGGSLGFLSISGDGTQQQVPRCGVESAIQNISGEKSDSFHSDNTATIIPTEHFVPREHNVSIGLHHMQNVSSVIHSKHAETSQNTSGVSDVKMGAGARNQDEQDVTSLNSHSVLCSSTPIKKAQKKDNAMATANKNQKKDFPVSYTSDQLQNAINAIQHDNLTVGQAARKYNIPKRTLFDHTMYNMPTKVDNMGENNHTKPAKKYTKEQLDLALKEVLEGNVTITLAAQKYGIPRRTLFDRAKGKTKDVEEYDKKTLHLELSVQEENDLVAYMEQLKATGQWFRMKDFKLNVLEMAERSEKPHRFNLDTGPTYLWTRRFASRHPELDTQQQSEAHNLFVKGQVNVDCVSGFFQFYGQLLQKHGLAQRPAQIFDCAQVYFGRESRIHSTQVATKEEVCAHMCVSASGRCLPVCMGYQKEIPKSELFRNSVPEDWLTGTSVTGEMTRTIFLRWFEMIFLRHCGTERPVILTLDNSDSLISLKVLDLASEHKVHLVVLRSQWNRHLQPLSLGISGSLLTNFCQLASQSDLTDANFIIDSQHLPKLLKQTLEVTLSGGDLIREGFAKAGLMPFDPTVVNVNSLKLKTK